MDNDMETGIAHGIVSSCKDLKLYLHDSNISLRHRDVLPFSVFAMCGCTDLEKR